MPATGDPASNQMARKWHGAWRNMAMVQIPSYSSSGVQTHEKIHQAEN